ncbi:hypothetical protein BH20ACT5_BH20ACT5_02470 [soil metagenome]
MTHQPSTADAGTADIVVMNSRVGTIVRPDPWICPSALLAVLDAVADYEQRPIVVDLSQVLPTVAIGQVLCDVVCVDDDRSPEVRLVSNRAVVRRRLGELTRSCGLPVHHSVRAALGAGHRSMNARCSR